MEINKADKIISLPDYRKQKSLHKISAKNEAINPLSSEDVAILKHTTPETGNVFNNKELSDSQAYLKARVKLIDYFKKEFIKSDDFKNTFGNLKWEEISEQVTDSIILSRDKGWEKEHYNDRAYAFTGRVYGLFTEIALDSKNGRLKRAFIEID